MAQRKALILLFCFVILTVFSGCFLKKPEKDIELPEDSLFHTQEWALVTEPYTPFYKAPSEQAEKEGYARRSEILEIKGRRIANDKKLWYSFEKGWMPETVIKVYSNQRKAERAASLLD